MRINCRIQILNKQLLWFFESQCIPPTGGDTCMRTCNTHVLSPLWPTSWEFRSTRKSVTHMEAPIMPTGERLQILPFTRHSWLLSSGGSLACHTYCDMGHPFILVFSEDPWHSHLLPSVWQCSCCYLFERLRSVAAGIRTTNLPLAGWTL